MELCLLLTIFLVEIAQFANGQEGQLRKCWNPGAEMSKNPYFIGNGFTCCSNIMIEHPIKPKSDHWKKCMEQTVGKGDEDISSILWKVYLCELSSVSGASGGTLSEENLTYKEFEMFSLRNHPEVVKSQILATNTNCEVPSDADIKTKFQKFESCFFQAEEFVCYNMSGAKPTQNHMNEKKMCEPVSSLKAPQHSFEIFAQPCCKGSELPFPLFDIFMDFDRFDLGQGILACTEKYKSKLKELNHPMGNTREPLAMCEVACVHEIDGFNGKYNANFEDLLNFKMKILSNSTKSQLMAIISKYQPTFEFFQDSANSVPISEAGALINKMDEAKQILNYCKFHFEAMAEGYRALYEHCYNSEYGNQFREDILKPAPAPPRN